MFQYFDRYFKLNKFLIPILDLDPSKFSVHLLLVKSTGFYNLENMNLLIFDHIISSAQPKFFQGMFDQIFEKYLFQPLCFIIFMSLPTNCYSKSVILDPLIFYFHHYKYYCRLSPVLRSIPSKLLFQFDFISLNYTASFFISERSKT